MGLQHGADASAPGARDAVLGAAGLERTTLLELLLNAGASVSGPRQASKLSDTRLEELADELGMAAKEVRGIDRSVPTPLQMAIHAKVLRARARILGRRFVSA
jgi:hypothetical protein